ncbi:hypothetical protein [Paludisphaera mucosa]|uniref:Uncharacterized protein n=1 Tax=Paludisphaera mucosa TaxID=3030827 RepID=A0ABT6F5A0_9BACT|nr:hypothetical protein [Paludisphaera mucosa]MDG3002702.1 hypothetical protein [Paludisphaera mucosa]
MKLARRALRAELILGLYALPMLVGLAVDGQPPTTGVLEGDATFLAESAEGVASALIDLQLACILIVVAAMIYVARLEDDDESPSSAPVPQRSREQSGRARRRAVHHLAHLAQAGSYVVLTQLYFSVYVCDIHREAALMPLPAAVLGLAYAMLIWEKLNPVEPPRAPEPRPPHAEPGEGTGGGLAPPGEAGRTVKADAGGPPQPPHVPVERPDDGAAAGPSEPVGEPPAESGAEEAPRPQP